MHDEYDLIHSPLQQHYTRGDRTVEICIYRMPHTSWTLEVIDEHGNSTVWDDEFETDQAAFDEVMRTIREDGITSLIGEPSHATEAKNTETSPLRLAAPLSIEEMEDLDAFLMSDATPDETMLLDNLDGYLTAIIIGPTTLNMSQWYSGIWGKHEDDAPRFETVDSLSNRTTPSFLKDLMRRPVAEAFARSIIQFFHRRSKRLISDVPEV